MNKKRTRRDTSLNVWPSFTDLITSIFIFAMFLLILMVVQNHISLIQLSRLHEIVGSIFKDLDELKQAMADEEVEVDKGTIVIKSDIIFPFNKWKIEDIPPQALEDLERIGEKLKSYLEGRGRNQKFRIVVEGHTDTIGPSENNDRLSYQRAQSLVLLWRGIGFTPEYYELIPAGLGESKPKIEVKRYDLITIYSDVFSPLGMWEDDTILPSAKEGLESIGQILKNSLDVRQQSRRFAISIETQTDTQTGSNFSEERAQSLVLLWQNIGLTPEYYLLISMVSKEEIETGKIMTASIDSSLRKSIEKVNRRVEVKIIPKFSELKPFYRSQ